MANFALLAEKDADSFVCYVECMAQPDLADLVDLVLSEGPEDHKGSAGPWRSLLSGELQTCLRALELFESMLAAWQNRRTKQDFSHKKVGPAKSFIFTLVSEK